MAAEEIVQQSRALSETHTLQEQIEELKEDSPVDPAQIQVESANLKEILAQMSVISASLRQSWDELQKMIK